MNTTPVTFTSTRQSNVDDRRLDSAQQDFNNALKSVDQDFDFGSKAPSLTNLYKTGDTSRREIEQQLRSVSTGHNADPTPASLSRQSNSWVEAGSTGWEPPTARRDASNEDTTTTTMGRTSRSDEQRRTDDQRRTDEKVRSDDARGSDDNVAPVTMHSRSNVTPSVLQNVGSIGANNGQSALFVHSEEKVSVDTIRNTLNNRFPDGNISVAQLVEQFNISEPRAKNFMRHHGTAGELSIDAFMRHVSRWQDEDGNLTQARFESAILNGASHLNVNRFEYEEGKGYEFRGFKELYRRAGGDLPDETLLKIFNQLKSLDMKGSDEHVERSELFKLGIAPDDAGDVEVSRILRAFDIAAFGEPESAPTPTPISTQKPALPTVDWTPPNPGNGHSQTIARPNGVPYILQQGNIQNIFDPSFFAGGGTASSNEWRSGNNTFKNIWP